MPTSPPKRRYLVADVNKLHTAIMLSSKSAPPNVTAHLKPVALRAMNSCVSCQSDVLQLMLSEASALLVRFTSLTSQPLGLYTVHCIATDIASCCTKAPHQVKQTAKT